MLLYMDKLKYTQQLHNIVSITRCEIQEVMFIEVLSLQHLGSCLYSEFRVCCYTRCVNVFRNTIYTSSAIIDGRMVLLLHG